MNIASIEDNSEFIGACEGDDGGVRFRVWAPLADRVDVVLMNGNQHSIPMEREPRGYFELYTREATVGSKYKFRLNGVQEYPDPASRYQPEGVHGPSQVVSTKFQWTDQNWEGLPLNQLVFYELHVGTFTDDGDFFGVAAKLPYLKELGINAIEIMPVAQFPGVRNWGYDGVGLFSAQNSYGGPESLKRLVDKCHSHGIAVFLDVVYNHLGPEGNYLAQFGRYFQTKYQTPWGPALNFDGDYSDEVRRYFLQNAKLWLDEFHFDGLRLDAIHAIFDSSAQPFLEDLSHLKNDLQKQLGRRLHLIAETDLNDSRVLKKAKDGGLGMDAQWADDFHHEIHALLTGESQGYYADYGKLAQLVAAYQNGIIFNGEYSEFRHRSHGRSYSGIDRSRLVVCSQNHDQIGNRMLGERLVQLVGEEKQKLAAACVFLSPFAPLIFMGEEYGETSPFLYFVNHGDPDLLKAVREGRREEFRAFKWLGEPPDPASPDTFLQSTLKWPRDNRAQKNLNYYKKLIALSKWIRSERILEPENCQVALINNDRVLKLSGRSGQSAIEIYFSFSDRHEQVQVDSNLGHLELAVQSWDDNVNFNHGELRVQPYGALAFVSRRNDAS